MSCNKSCCPTISETEKKYLYHKHEANRLRFFNKLTESYEHETFAVIYRNKLLEEK